MNEKEIDTIEQVIKWLSNTIVALTHQKTEIELRINELEASKDTLIRLLPTDNRIDHLFH